MTWRTVHIDEQEWRWVVSKGICRHVVIKGPDNKCHKALIDDAITPGKVKTYIKTQIIK